MDSFIDFCIAEDILRISFNTKQHQIYLKPQNKFSSTSTWFHLKKNKVELIRGRG